MSRQSPKPLIKLSSGENLDFITEILLLLHGYLQTYKDRNMHQLLDVFRATESNVCVNLSAFLLLNTFPLASEVQHGTVINPDPRTIT